MTLSSGMNKTTQFPGYLASLLDNKADQCQPYVFAASDDSGQILFCPVTLTTEVVTSSTTPMAEDLDVSSAPPDLPSAAF